MGQLYDYFLGPSTKHHPSRDAMPFSRGEWQLEPPDTQAAARAWAVGEFIRSVP